MMPGVPCPKPVRVKSPENLAAVRRRPCRICGGKSEPHHIRTRGAGGGDELTNLMALCRLHHRRAHDVGWTTFTRVWGL